MVVNPPNSIIKDIEKSKFKKRIIHIPKIIGDNKLAIAYSSFDIMAHIAEKGESFGYVLTESILCETPVVTLNTPWADNSQAEVVDHLNGGYVVNSKKYFIQAILQYMKNPNSVNINKGRLNIIQRYHYEQVAIDIIEQTMYKKGYTNIEIIKNNLLKIMDSCYGKPNIIAKIMIKYNLYKFRKLNLYNYPIKYLKDEIKRRILKKIFNKS